MPMDTLRSVRRVSPRPEYNAADMMVAAEIGELQAKVEAAKADKAEYAEVDRLEEKLHSVGGIKRTFVGTLAESPFTKTRTIVQYYIEDFDYTADRCATCHFASDKAGYEGFVKEQFEEIEGDGENSLTLQLNIIPSLKRAVKRCSLMRKTRKKAVTN